MAREVGTVASFGAMFRRHRRRRRRRRRRHRRHRRRHRHRRCRFKFRYWRCLGRLFTGRVLASRADSLTQAPTIIRMISETIDQCVEQKLI